jgi:hypothetical protein
MRLDKSLLCGISALTLATGAAFAGEDSTHRWHGTGSEYHQDGGLLLFGEADAVGSEQFSEPNIDPATTSISYSDDTYYLIPSERMMTSEPEPGVIYVYPMETLVLIPSEDSEMPPLG